MYLDDIYDLLWRHDPSSSPLWGLGGQKVETLTLIISVTSWPRKVKCRDLVGLDDIDAAPQFQGRDPPRLGAGEGGNFWGVILSRQDFHF